MFSAESKQEALLFKQYNRRYLTFNFKGKGHAQLQFFFIGIFIYFKVNISNLNCLICRSDIWQRQSFQWNVYLFTMIAYRCLSKYATAKNLIKKQVNTTRKCTTLTEHRLTNGTAWNRHSTQIDTRQQEHKVNHTCLYRWYREARNIDIRTH